MKVTVFNTKKYDREFLGVANASRHELGFFEPHLGEETVGLATGFEAVCVFVNDQVDVAVIARLHSLGMRLIALRCAGYNSRSEEAGFSLHLDEIEGEWKAELAL